MKYYYSPHTLELIETNDPSDWMLSTDKPTPYFDKNRGEGCFFKDGNWEVVLPSKLSLSDRKQALINELETAYDISRYEPITYLNTTFQADKDSQQLITDVLVAAGFTMPLGFMWRDSNNVAVNVEGNLLHGLAQAILMRAQPLFWEKSAKKDEINACLTDADLDLYLNPPV